MTVIKNRTGPQDGAVRTRKGLQMLDHRSGALSIVSSQSAAKTPPELLPPLLLLRPLQIGVGAHEPAKFVEAFGNVVPGQRLQQDQDGSVSFGVKQPEVGEVQFISAPVRLDEVFRQDKDGPPTALNGVHDVVHDPLSRKKIPLVKAKT